MVRDFQLLIPACKELRNCRSALNHKYKAEQTEKSTDFLRSVKEVRSQSKLLFPELGGQTGGYGELQLSGAEIALGSSSMVENPEL